MTVTVSACDASSGRGTGMQWGVFVSPLTVGAMFAPLCNGAQRIMRAAD